MKERRSRLAGRWGTPLPIVLVARVFQTGGTIAAAQAGAFPTFIPIPEGSARGVAVDKTGNVYVSIGKTLTDGEHIQILKFSPDGDRLFPEAVDIGQGTIGGLMVSATGDLYVAVAAGTDRGVYRMNREGQIELLPGSDQIFFANGLAFDDVGTLWVTESVSIASPPPNLTVGPGSIWRIRRGGAPELALRDPLLAGTGALGNAFPIGANGIAFYHGNLFVTNTETGKVLRMSVSPDGSVGSLEVWTTLEEMLPPSSPLAMKFPLVMGDGIALDVHGNLYVAALTRSAVIRINLSDKSQQTVAVFPFPFIPEGSLPSARLDFPASLFFGTGTGERTNLFVTNLGLGKWVGPSLVKIDAGVPGRPLH